MFSLLIFWLDKKSLKPARIRAHGRTKTFSVWAALTHFMLISCHNGVLTNSHLPYSTRNSLTIIIMSDFSFGMHGNAQHSSLVVPLKQPDPLTSWWSLNKLLPAIHFCSLWVAPAVVVLCNGPVGEPLGMPCICNDHSRHMGVLLFINSKGFQLGICGWLPSGLRVYMRGLWGEDDGGVLLKTAIKEMMKYSLVFIVNSGSL